MNSIVLIYAIIYLFCGIKFSNVQYISNTVQRSGIILLTLLVIRHNIFNSGIKHTLNKISKDASTDPLTGLYSRKYTSILMRSLYKSSLYFSLGFSVLMLDIDYFKKLNDTWGHACGDEVLRETAKLICGNVDTSSIVCRYGGEEFLIILLGVNQGRGTTIAEKIRSNIEAYSFHVLTSQSPVKITVSIGGSTAGSETQNATDLIEQADKALYKAKEERNRTLWFS